MVGLLLGLLGLPRYNALVYKAQTNWHFIVLSGGQPPSEPPRAAGAKTAQPATEFAIDGQPPSEPPGASRAKTAEPATKFAIGGGFGLVWTGRI